MWTERVKAREFLRRLRLSQLLHSELTLKELLDQEAVLLTRLHQTALAPAVPNSDRLSALRDYEAAERGLHTVWHEIEPIDQEYVSLRKGEPISWDS